MLSTDVKSRAWLASCFSLACFACSHVITTASTPPQVVRTVQAGARVVVLLRPTPGLVRLSLYIDAGSRDATPPQAATVAAWLAAEQAGSAVEALVYPDVTELSRSCEPRQLASCLEELGRALARRAPTAAQLLSAHARLESARRRALSADPDQRTDVLAASALLGDDALGFFPLGRAEDDPLLTAAGVGRFLRDHYGPRRLLLVAAGDVEAARLHALAGAMLSTLPAAAAMRTARALEPAAEPALRTAIDNRASLGFALAGRDESALRARAVALSERLLSASESSDGVLTGHVFGVRGGALALLRVSGDPSTLMPRAARELARLQLEPPPPGAASRAGDDLVSLSRVQGFQFGTRDQRRVVAATSGVQFAAGMLIAGEPGAGPRTKPAVDARDEQRRARAQFAFASAIASGEPRTSGDIGDHAAAVVTENGARIDVQQAHGPYIAIAVRIALGAELDPSELHGRSALLAMLTASACAGMGPERLRVELARLGAAIEPRVSAESYGISLRAPADHWQGALDLALRCARMPSRDAANFAFAALRLQATLASGGAEFALRAQLSDQISPRAPGMLAPWGNPGRIGNLSPRDVADLFRASELGARWSVALVGEVPIAEATARIARRVADLPAGALPKEPRQRSLEPVAWTAPASIEADALTLLATWDARGTYAHRLGATVLASALHAVLALTPGLEVQWQDADVYAAGAYAALRLRASAELVPRMAAMLSERVARLDAGALEEALRRGAEVSRSAQTGAEAEASVRAEQLARARLGARFGAPTLEDARVLLAALRRVPVRIGPASRDSAGNSAVPSRATAP